MSKTFGVLAILLLLIQCKFEKELEQKDIMGQWKVTGAVRDGKKTQTINGAVFIFSQDSLKTNFTGQDEIVPYRLEKNKLILDHPLFSEMKIKIDTSSKLLLSTGIQSVDFTLSLQRENHVTQ